MRGPFVGREVEFNELAEVVATARSDASPAAAVVVGAPGSGKSRLLGEVGERISPPVLRITGYEPEKAVPLTAARDLLRTLSRAPDHGAALDTMAFGAQPQGHPGAPMRLFEAAYRCLAEGGPITVLIDDLQWVDDMSAALLNYLVRASHMDGLSMAVLCAGRPGRQTGAVRDALSAVLADRLHDVELASLSEAAGMRLIQDLAPGMASDDARRIWEKAAGSPFWIEALAVETGLSDGSLTRRFSQLSEDASEALQALAIIGRPARRSDLGAALDWPAERIERAVAELSARGLAVEHSGAIGASHDLIREAARRALPEETARDVHARLADHLQRAAGGDVRLLREALDHAVAAGHDPLWVGLLIARAPQRRLIGSSGVRHIAALLDDSDSRHPQRAELERALAELATELGDRPLELDRWTTVADHCDGLARARALHAAAKAAYRLGLREHAAELVERARSAGATDSALDIALDAQEAGILRWLAHRLPEARDLTTRAVQRTEEAITQARQGSVRLAPRLRSAAIEALNAAYDLSLQEGRESDQVNIAERLLEVADDELEELEARLLLASAYRRSGRMVDGERVARRVRDLATRRLYPAVVVTAGHHLARALYGLGRMAEAEAAAAEAERLSVRIGATGRFLSEMRSLRPAIAVARGDWRAGIDRLRDDLEREPDPHYQLGIHQEIAMWLARLAGQSAAADVRSSLAAADACLTAVGCPRCGRELALRSSEALSRIGEVEQARDRMASPALARARHSFEGRVFLGQAIGAFRLAADRPERAAMSLGNLSRRLIEAGLMRDALWADLDRGAALALFDRSAAVDVYRSVAARAEAGGALTDLTVAKQRLRALGARTAPPRRTKLPMDLSRREYEVARLVASGKSNPEIAQTLFVSRKTVERHVSAALKKVGARNRAELAARLTEATTS